MVLINSTDRLKSHTSKKESCNEQSYVRTQLTIAISSLTRVKTSESHNEQPYVRSRSRWRYNLSNATLFNFNQFAQRPYVRARIAIAKNFTQAQQISYEKTRNEQKYGRTQQALSSKTIKIIKIIIIKSQAYLLLTSFADPS